MLFLRLPLAASRFDFVPEINRDTSASIPSATLRSLSVTVGVRITEKRLFGIH